jgi:hypothetical protein
MARVGTDGVNSKMQVFETPPAVAVSVTACAAVTESTVAVKVALLEPAATVTVAGTFTAVLLLDRLTLAPPVPAAALRLTVQASVPAPVKDELAHRSARNDPCAAV